MINYQNIADACFHYSSIGYTSIEVPWWVPEEIVLLTKPPVATDREDFFLPINKKYLVASGEQSFLYLAKENKLSPGRYFTTTPCFRDETETLLSRKYFVKTELIDTQEVGAASLKEMIDDALSFFETHVPDRSKLEVVETYEGFDINYKGIELGSYGIRSCPFLTWVYGTGCAEPRLSIAALD